MTDLYADRFELQISGVHPLDTIDGTGGADSLTGTDGDDQINGRGGADTLDGGKGGDSISGAAGDDEMLGGKGSDSLAGGNGDDLIHGASDVGGDGAASDTMEGGAGADTLIGSGQADLMDGGADDDLILTVGGADTAHGGDGADVIAPALGMLAFCDGAQLYGEAGDDVVVAYGSSAKGALGGTLSGGDGADTLQMKNFGGGEWLLDGGIGNDFLLCIGKGDDSIDGGDGEDVLSYIRAGKQVVVDLSTGIATGTTIGQDTLIGIEDLTGGLGNDSLSGDDTANVLEGRGGQDAIGGDGGDDVLKGGGASDIITGGLGSDTMDGGAGPDTFIYYSTGDSIGVDPDQIVGLKKHDAIDLSSVDADVNTGGDQAFVRVDAFTGQAGELVLSYDGDRTSVLADTDGDGSADMVIELIGNHLTYSAFVL